MDRFARGFIIGMTASAVKDALSFFSYYVLGFSKATYAHLMGAIIFGRAIKTTPELILE